MNIKIALILVCWGVFLIGCDEGSSEPTCHNLEGQERKDFASEMLINELQRFSRASGDWGIISNGFRLTGDEIENLNAADFSNIPVGDVIIEGDGYVEDFEYVGNEVIWRFHVAFMADCSVNIGVRAFDSEL